MGMGNGADGNRVKPGGGAKLVAAGAAALLFLSGLSFAEAQEGRGLTGFGLKGGLCLATVIGGEAEDSRSVTGMVGGIFLTWNLDYRYAFQPEVLYCERGFRGSVDGGPDRVRLSYVTVPLLARWFPSFQEDLKPSLYAGPVPAFLVSAEAAEGGKVQDVKDDVNAFDVAVALGTGIELELGAHAAILDMRYEIGLLDGSKGEGGRLTNSDFLLMLGWSF